MAIAPSCLVPAIGDAVIEQAIPVPEGGDIILAQREAVNDAWDLPKEATMDPFIARHPEWAEYAAIERPFDWKWYYAFQQVGDQTVEQMSRKRRDAILKRDHTAGWLALFSPSSMVTRMFTGRAQTDTKAALSYQQRVRDYHTELRNFYYPLLFTGVNYDQNKFSALPEYSPEG